MLPKANRLTKKKDFDTVFAGGKSAKGTFLIAKSLENSGNKSRFGFVVSKKVSPKATVRNKIRRQLRRAVAMHLAAMAKPHDVVIITLPPVAKKKFDEIVKEAAAVFKKLGA